MVQAALTHDADHPTYLDDAMTAFFTETLWANFYAQNIPIPRDGTYISIPPANAFRRNSECTSWDQLWDVYRNRRTFPQNTDGFERTTVKSAGQPANADSAEPEPE